MKHPFFDSKEEAITAEHEPNERLFWFEGPGVKKYAWCTQGVTPNQLRHFATKFFGLTCGVEERASTWTQHVAAENAALKEELAKLRDELELTRLKNGQAVEPVNAH